MTLGVSDDVRRCLIKQGAAKAGRGSGAHDAYPASGVASPVTTNHTANGSVFVNLRNAGNF